MRSIVAASILAAALAAGCAATVATDAYGPDLVSVSPGVQVIADYDEPVFYSEHYYWRQQNGRWYHSAYHDHGWSEAQAPAAIVRIHEPNRYRHYKPAGYQPRALWRRMLLTGLSYRW